MGARHFSAAAWFGAVLLLVTGTSAERLVLKDGTVLEGTVIRQKDSYWIKTPDGQSQIIPAERVASVGGDPSPTPTPGSTPTVVRPAGPTFAATRVKAEAADTPAAAVTFWQQYVDANPASADLATARQELARWQALADSGAEKISGKWVGGDQLKSIHEKAQALLAEAQELSRANQTIQAVKKLEEAAKVYPNSFDVNFSLGTLAMMQHKEDDALRWFEQALKVKPNAPEALANMGIIQFAVRKQHEKGIQLLQRAAEAGDHPLIAIDLLKALAEAPQAIQKSVHLKAAREAASLLAAKYSLTGRPLPKDFLIVPLLATAKAGPGPGVPSLPSWNGTGFLVSADGLVLTNRHVAQGAKTLRVVLGDKPQQSRPAEVVAIDDQQDLAVIRIQPAAGEKLPFLRLARADAPNPGADCTVLGYPLIDRLGRSLKVTRGGVTSVESARVAGPDVIIDAKVNPGNSGGPILDRHAQVMAIVSMKSVATAMEDSYGMGISAGRIRRFLAKHRITLPAPEETPAVLTAEEASAGARPATVCILASRS